MKIKNNIFSIEFFGMPGSGKTYLSKILKKYLNKKGFEVINARECITKYSSELINLKFGEKISLLYFKLINLKNRKNLIKQKININKSKIIQKKISFFTKNYIKICKRISYKNNKFINNYKKILKLFKNHDLHFKTHYSFWFFELVAAHQILKKISNNKNIILLLDEGMIQRSFLLYKFTKQKSVFTNYFKTAPLCSNIYFIKNNKKKIFFRNKLRKAFENHKYKKNSEIYLMKEFLDNFLLKKKYFKFVEITNFSQILLKKNI